MSAGGTRVRGTEALALVVVLLALGARGMADITTPSAEYDEGVYVASAQALAGGARLGAEVFASQPPLFFDLLRWVGELSADPVVLRGVALFWTLATSVAAWALLRPSVGAGGALLAALLVGLAPGVIDRAAVVGADVPAVCLALWALVAARHRPTPSGAAVAGALSAAALLVKLLALPLVVAVAVAVGRGAGRRGLLAAAAGAGAVALALAALHSRDLGAIWDGTVGLRGSARGVELPGPDDAPVPVVFGLVALGAAALVTLIRRRGDATLVVALVASIAFVAVHRPLFLHHLVVVAVPAALLAVLAGDGRAWLPRLALVAALVPGAVAGRELLRGDELANIDRAAAAVRAGTLPGERVLTDLPLVAIRAGRPSDPRTIDASYVRVGSGALSPALLSRVAEGAGAVVIGRALRGTDAESIQLDRFDRRLVAGTIVVRLRRGVPLSSSR